MRPTARRIRRRQPLAIALYVNAASLLALVVAIVSRGGISQDGSAFAAPAAHPLAGGQGLYLTPGQVSLNTWGCYVMDTDRQTLLAYEFNPGEKKLKLLAARDISNDRELKDLNTIPSPEDIRRINQVEKSGVRGREPPPRDREQQVPGTSPSTQPGGPTIRIEPENPGIPKASDINGPNPQ